MGSESLLRVGGRVDDGMPKPGCNAEELEGKLRGGKTKEQSAVLDGTCPAQGSGAAALDSQVVYWLVWPASLPLVVSAKADVSEVVAGGWATMCSPRLPIERAFGQLATAQVGIMTNVLSLGLADVTMTEDDEVMTVPILGKRSKERLVYFNNGAALADCLDIRGGKLIVLFRSGKGGHLIKGQRMTGQAIRDMLNRRAKQAGIENVTPHDLRRSFVSGLLDAGVDISTVANMAGHANVQTTRRYDRRGEEVMKGAARSLHVPYVRRERLMTMRYISAETGNGGGAVDFVRYHTEGEWVPCVDSCLALC